MFTTTIFPGRYVQGAGAIHRFGQEMARFAESGFVICDPYVLEHVLPDLASKVGNEIGLSVEKFGGECSDEEIGRLVGLAKSAGSQVVAGIGGGKTLDTAKAVAYEIGQPIVVVPTAASTDAPCSALAVIYTPQGEYQRLMIFPKNPDVVLVDTELVAKAPVRLLVSGMGDALATWFEAESARVNYAANMTGDLGSMTAYALSRLCYDTLLRDGVNARISCEVGAVTPALERIVEANTLLSGLGFESGGLGAAHAIHNGLTVLDQTHNSYHGEKVAIGTLASLFLTDKPSELIDEVYTFCEQVGLPIRLGEVGLENVTDEELMKVAEAACAEGETIHNEPRPITPQDVVWALKAADAEGRMRMWSEDEFLAE